MNGVPASERTHIGFFGRRNAGKSSLINAVTGQDLSIVSDVKGTTTDPVLKTMELLPLGPVVIIDTPGIDDEGKLGEMRVRKAYQALRKCDIAVVVIDSVTGISEEDKKLIELIKENKIPYIICMNKCDLKIPDITEDNEIAVSAEKNINIHEFKEKLASFSKKNTDKKIIGDRLNAGDIVVLVIPLDSSAPKGRIILPQQMVLREVLDAKAIAICVQPSELSDALENLSKKPVVIITDSQVFGEVSKLVPNDIYLTSFSILMLNYKGELDMAYRGVKAIDNLKDGDKVLIAEGCTHHRQCEDIGSVKIPNLMKKKTEKEIIFEFTSGGDFPDDLSEYSLVVHCGGCMLNENEVKRRMNHANSKGIPVTNYGITLAYMNGILENAMKWFY